jgi:hypothetical protein
MIVYAKTPPTGNFTCLGSPTTLKEVAIALFEDRSACLQGCSKLDLAILQLVSEPYSYDMVFVPTPGCHTGDVYFTRKTAPTPVELLRPAAAEGFASPADWFRRTAAL